MTEKRARNDNDRKEGAPRHDGASSPRLVARLGGQTTVEQALGDEVRIGRGRDNDLVLPGTRLARYHARIYRQGDHYFLCNVGSNNYTWVNGISLIGHRRLRPGDRLVLGDVELIFEADVEPAKESPSAAGRPEPASRSAAAGPAKSPAGKGASRPPAGGNGRRSRLAFTLTPAGVVVLLVLIVLAVYFLLPGLFEPPEPTREPTPTATVATAQPTATRAPSATPTPRLATSGTSSPVAAVDELLAQADALVLGSKFEAAIDIYQTVAREQPDDVRSEIGWAWALLLDGLPDQALLHARRASELAPLSAEASTILARAYVEMNEADSALSWAQRAVGQQANSAGAQAVLAQALLLGGRPKEAEAQAVAAVATDPSSAEAHRVLGLLYQAIDNDPQRAAVELQAAAELQPQLWLRHHELGLALLQARDYDRAIVSLTSALVLRHKAATFTALGQTYYQMGQYDQAKSFLEQSLSAGAWDADTYALLAALNAQQGRCKDARIYFEQALEQDPAHTLAREARAACAPALPSPQVPATAVAVATPTEPPPAPLAGQIAFPVWNRDLGHYDTYLARVDGSDRRLVVEQMHQPALRPDGQWLAVNGERPQHMNLFVVRPDGSDLRGISGYVEDTHPAWSPDGQGLVLGSTRHPDRASRVYIIDQVSYDGTRAEGRVLRCDLYEVLGQRPTWTAGGQIVYNSCDHTVTPPHCGLFAMSAEPGLQTPEPLTDHASDTAPSVHGTNLAFMSNRDENWEIYVLQMGTTTPLRLTRNTANDGLPVWSPDGRTLAFVSDQGGVWAVWAMNPDGSQRRKLFDLGGGGLAFDWQEESISWGP